MIAAFEKEPHLTDEDTTEKLEEEEKEGISKEKEDFSKANE
jgi:hypothetical protein